MKPVVTEDWVLGNREKIFANDAAYQAAVPMAGRADALKMLCDAIRNEDSAPCVAISDHLGAGKSFLVKNALLKLAKEINEEKDVFWTFVDKVGDGADLRASRARVLIVDDIDRKVEPVKIQRVVDAIAGTYREDRTTIFIGDYTVRNVELMAPIMAKATIKYAPLEPLDLGLLKKAVSIRISHHILAPLEDVEPQVDRLLDGDLIGALLPPTDPPIATFREVFGFLQKIAAKLQIDDTPCVLRKTNYRASYPYAVDLPRGPVRDFVVKLHELIAIRAKRGERWVPLSVAEWAALMDSKMDLEFFREDVLEPLARAQVLLPMGMAYSTEKKIKFPAPYLPTVETFMAAMLGRDGP